MDFILSQHSNRLFLRPISAPAQRYANRFFSGDAEYWIGNKTPVPLANLIDILNGIQTNGLTIVGDSNQSDEGGRIGVVLVVYLAAFVLTLILFSKGYHSLAFVALVLVWAVLAAYLHKAGRS